jgi:hypothetical protein
MTELSSQDTGSFGPPQVLTTRQRLRVSPMWYNGLRCGQVFSDPHERTLEYHVVPHDRYCSYIDSCDMRIDLDAAGCPVLLELGLQPQTVRYNDSLVPPQVDYVQRHRFLDFPIQHRSPHIEVNPLNSLCHIVLSRRMPAECWAFAPGAAWEVDEGSCLVGVWLANPVADPSGCRRAAWRLGVWQAYRRGRLAEIASPKAHLEHGWLSLPKIFP